ncbi:hypothetical protein MG290_03840 [Flavobacterium sp. CBA20B-1]|uniref:Uncharacterized protein n=1 Tax=Paenimyroides aestuarii TaxID=2968490 RepID=A0ABY5NR40_9FLAO|nr:MULTISPECIES: hypothetical protein [Flavobacteriaceae]UUV21015.1 hypothetical protein NPX36_11900 [Paenimyroides aestuarii]WCM42825.1 hypothetical protein MG290_03840 [Flavobacterium sp. CBA20B-1]
MKRIFLVSFLALTGLASQAQENVSKNALGLRFGDSDGFGAEVSYQRLLSENNRLEIDLGWRSSKNYDAIKATGIYQWLWNIDGGFNWYAGVGGGLGSWSYSLPNYNESDLFIFAAGQIGIEYNFDIPLQVSLDFRPELYLNGNDYHDNFGPDIALGVRYKF